MSVFLQVEEAIVHEQFVEGRAAGGGEVIGRAGERNYFAGRKHVVIVIDNGARLCRDVQTRLRSGEKVRQDRAASGASMASIYLKIGVNSASVREVE